MPPRAIQQSLLPQTMPFYPRLLRGGPVSRGLLTRSAGDYLDVVTEPGRIPSNGRRRRLQAKGARVRACLHCLSLRPFRAPRPTIPYPAGSSRGRFVPAALGGGCRGRRRRYVTAIFLRLDPASSEMELVNAGPQFPHSWSPPEENAVRSHRSQRKRPSAMLSRLPLHDRNASPSNPGARILLYTDGLTEGLPGRRGVRPGNGSWRAFRAIDAFQRFRKRSPRRRHP